MGEASPPLQLREVTGECSRPVPHHPFGVPVTPQGLDLLGLGVS